MKRGTTTGALAAALLMSGSAGAYEAGDWIVRSGVATVSPNDASGSLNLAGTGPLAGTGVEIDSDTQLLLNITYMAKSSLGIELLAATPFEHDVKTTGLGGLGIAGVTDVDLASIKHLPPTLTLLWYPLASSSRFQPFIGGGVNYTWIFDESLSGAAETTLGADDLELDDSWGLAFRTGFDYLFDERWSVHGGVYYLDIDTDASLDTALGSLEVDVQVDPWVYSLGIGYRF